MLRLTKFSCILTGLLFLAIIYIGTRLHYIIGSESVKGKFVFYIQEVIQNEKVAFPIIEYTVKDSVYQFRAKENTEYKEGETVSVLLRNKDPNLPKLYDFNSFWLYPLIYFALPALIWVCFAASYIAKNDLVLVGINPPLLQRIKKS